MNQEQLNTVADIFNEAKIDLINKGEFVKNKDKVAGTINNIISCMSCYLYAYKDIKPDTYDMAKNILQNITDLITIGVDIETCQAKEGEFSVETQHLIYLGDGE